MPTGVTAGQTSFEKLKQLRTPRGPSVHRHRWRWTQFKASVTSAENTDTKPKSVGVRSKEGQTNLNARSVEKDIMDSFEHEAAHLHQGSHRKVHGKVVEKETARGTQQGWQVQRWKKVEPGGRQRKGKERSTYQRTQRASRGTMVKSILGTVLRQPRADRSRRCELRRSR